MDMVFPSLIEFAAFMARNRAVEFAADTGARAAAAEFITDKVRARIGKADELAPPLAASTVDDREKQGFSSNETLLRTGELQESYVWDHGSPIIARRTYIGSNDIKALVHEFGTDDAGRGNATTIPGRAPLSRTMQDHEVEAFALFAKTFDALFRPR